MQIAALAARFGADQHLCVVPEAADGLLLLLGTDAAVEDRHAVVRLDSAAQVVLGVLELGENHDLVGRVALKDPVERTEQLRGLRRRGSRCTNPAPRVR